jgi:hypothetical protein
MRCAGTSSGSGTDDRAGATWAELEGGPCRSSPPRLIADTIAKAVTARRPKTRSAVGYGAKPMIFLHALLPNRIFDAFIRRATGVPS